MSGLYARKPHPVKAVQWNAHGDHPDVAPVDAGPQHWWIKRGAHPDTHGQIRIPGQGIMLVSPGDWIVDGQSIYNPHRMIVPAGRFSEDYQPYQTKEKNVSEQTKGQYRVGSTFNPSKDDVVAQIKAQAASLIDLIDTIPTRIADQHGGETDDERAAERARLKALAMTHVEDAAMWAVKATTKPARGKGEAS